MDPLTWDNTEFCQFIDSTFTYFREAGVKKLIIDLRYNPGGDNSFSDYLISYLTSRVITSKISIKTSQITKDYWKKSEVTEHQELKNKILSHKNGEYFEYTIGKIIPHPDSVRFKGKVYVLINRYSLSNSMGVAAIMQDNEIGKIVGEETAEIVGAFGASHMFKLPNTKLSVQYPKSGTRLNDDITPRGVIPDYPIEEDIFTDTDDVLEYTLKLIKQN
jgi:C-terminal processing protease CtpA/Prc